MYYITCKQINYGRAFPEGMKKPEGVTELYDAYVEEVETLELATARVKVLVDEGKPFIRLSEQVEIEIKINVKSPV